MGAIVNLQVLPGTSSGASFLSAADVASIDLYNLGLLTEVTEAKFCDVDANNYVTGTTSNFPVPGGSTLQTMAPAATVRAPYKYATDDGQYGIRSGYNSVQSQATATADAGTDVITAAVGLLAAGANVSFASTVAVPAPLVAGQRYYARDGASGSFKVSATRGGPAIDLTDAGSGTITVSYDVANATRSTLRSTNMPVPSGAWAVAMLGVWDLPPAAGTQWAVNDTTLRFGAQCTSSGVIRFYQDITAGTFSSSAAGVNDGARHLWLYEWDGTLSVYKDGVVVLTSTTALAAAVDRLFRTFSNNSGASDATAPGTQGAGYWEFHGIGKPGAAFRAWAKAKALSYHPTMTIA